MPVIRLEYDNAIVDEHQAREFCEAIRRIVIDATRRPESEVCVYANSAQIKLNIAPVQAWLEMSDKKIANADALAKDIRKQIAEWKTDASSESPLIISVFRQHQAKVLAFIFAI